MAAPDTFGRSGEKITLSIWKTRPASYRGSLSHLTRTQERSNAKRSNAEFDSIIFKKYSKEKNTKAHPLLTESTEFTVLVLICPSVGPLVHGSVSMSQNVGNPAF